MTEGELIAALRELPSHSVPLPPESRAPLEHFLFTYGALVKTLGYVARKVGPAGTLTPTGTTHLGRVRQMALVSLVENLERFLKESAAECIDIVAPVTADDRFKSFADIKVRALVGHYEAGTIGRALSESQVWTKTETINDRFRDILADPSMAGRPLPPFHLLPNQPGADQDWFNTLQLVWQLRHTVVHNVGVVTRSDAVKLRVFAKQPVPAPRVLVPTVEDIDYLGRFLRETAIRCNTRVAERLAALLTRIQADDPALLDPVERARYLADTFRVPVTVAGENAAPPP